MRKIKITVDNKGNIVTDFDGFSGSACFKEAQKLVQALKELGVDIEIRHVLPKDDTKVQESQNQLVREG